MLFLSLNYICTVHCAQTHHVKNRVKSSFSSNISVEQIKRIYIFEESFFSIFIFSLCLQQSTVNSQHIIIIIIIIVNEDFHSLSHHHRRWSKYTFVVHFVLCVCLCQWNFEWMRPMCKCSCLDWVKWTQWRKRRRKRRTKKNNLQLFIYWMHKHWAASTVHGLQLTLH